MIINCLLWDHDNSFAGIWLNYWLFIFILKVFGCGLEFRLDIFEISFRVIHTNLCEDCFFAHWNNCACFPTHTEDVRYPVWYGIIGVKLDWLSLTQWFSYLIFNYHIVKGDIGPSSNRHLNILWFRLVLHRVTLFWMHNIQKFLIWLICFWLAAGSAWARFKKFKWK
jgi:hypothetical protein